MKKKALSIVGIIGLTMVYAFYLYFCFGRLALNSDMANMVLEANDIIHGNYFLSDWWLTGVTFLTTDLFYFVIGTLVFGVSQASFILAETIMFFVALVSGTILLNMPKKKAPLLYMVLFLSFVLFPCPNWCSVSLVHMGYVGWGFIGLALLISADHSDEKRKIITRLVLAALMFVLAQTGDAISILTIVAPVMIVSCLDGLKLARKKHEISAFPKKNFYYILVGIISFIASKCIDKLFIAIGGAERNSYLGERTFIAIADLGNSIATYFSGILSMSYGNIESQPIGSLQTILMGIRMLVVFAGIIVVFFNIISYLKGKDVDRLGLILSIGYLFVSGVCIVTVINIPRYYSYAPFVLGIILIRFLCTEKAELLQQISAKVTAIVLSVVLGASTLFPIADFSLFYNPTHVDILNVLKESNLTNGYGSFWYASAISVLSGNEVTVRSISGNGNSNLSIMTWFCKNSWYDEPANFVIIEPTEYGGVSEVNVIRNFGQPVNIINVDNCKIYVYDHDISNDLDEWWNIQDGVNHIDTAKSFFNSNFDQAYGEPYISDGEGWLIYGPYAEMEAGDYSITYSYHYADEVIDTDDIGYCDINSNSGSFDSSEYIHGISGGSTSTSFDFSLQEDCTDFEVRVYTYREGLVLDSIEIVKH